MISFFVNKTGVIIFGTAIGIAFGAADATAQTNCSTYDKIVLQEYPGVLHSLTAWVGIEKGIYKKYCLDASTTTVAAGPAALATSLQGGLTYMSGSPENGFVAAGKGMDLKIVGFQNQAINYALVVRKDIPLPHLKEGFPAVMKDLVGKKLGVNAFGTASDALSRYSFQVAGLDPDKSTWVAYGPISAGIAALQNGTLDAGAFFADGIDVAAAVIGGPIVADLRDPETKKLFPLVADMNVQLTWQAQADYVRKNGDAVQRFFKASNEAVEWIHDPKNLDEVIKIVKRRAPLPEGTKDSEKVYKERTVNYIKYQSIYGDMKSLKAWSDWDIKMGRLSKPADIETMLYDTARSVLK